MELVLRILQAQAWRMELIKMLWSGGERREAVQE
jgi:hypothetical protein